MKMAPEILDFHLIKFIPLGDGLIILIESNLHETKIINLSLKEKSAVVKMPCRPLKGELSLKMVKK